MLRTYEGILMKIEINISDEVESTASPYWLILDPKQNMTVSLYALASMITGPFFSRNEAERVLKDRSHHYSKRARVFCHTGCYTHQYDDKCQRNKYPELNFVSKETNKRRTE